MVGNVLHQTVFYSIVGDVANNQFVTPSKHPSFQHITIPPNLINKQIPCRRTENTPEPIEQPL